MSFTTQASTFVSERLSTQYFDNLTERFKESILNQKLDTEENEHLIDIRQGEETTQRGFDLSRSLIEKLYIQKDTATQHSCSDIPEQIGAGNGLNKGNILKDTLVQQVQRRFALSQHTTPQKMPPVLPKVIPPLQIVKSF